MALFRLRWGDYDTEQNYFLSGPDNVTGEEFLALCSALIRPAAQIALEMKGNTWQEHFEKSDPQEFIWMGQVGWMNIVQVLAYKLLPQHGFHLIEIPTATFNGPGIIWDHDDDPHGLMGEFLGEIIEYNKSIFKKSVEEREDEKCIQQGNGQDTE